MSKIVVVKLSTGEEIIGTVAENVVMVNNDDLALTKILRIAVDLDEQGRPMMGFAPWGFTSQETKVIDRRHVLFVEQPIDAIRQQYQQVTGQIMTAPTSLITG